jgi:eukaryotic-like serine/threonine-protein kinase
MPEWFGTLDDVTEAQRFGRYRVTGTLGSGGMGEVFAAVDDVLGREVAVKTLRGHRNGLAARLLDERFRQEARAIALLAHANVVAVYDLDLSADPPYLVMERVAGPTLKDRLAKGRLGAAELRAVGIQIANALAAAHATGIVHRDVKPANILAAADGMWKLADFGVAHVPDSALTMTGQFVGSPAYAAHEALVRGQSGPAADIYGLGATLYEAAAGRWPRADATTGALFAPQPPLRDLVPDLPVALARAIDRAVSVEPDARPTATQLAEALAGDRAPRALLPWQRWALIGGGAFVGLVIIAAIVRSPTSPAAAAEQHAVQPQPPQAEVPAQPPPDQPPPPRHGPKGKHSKGGPRGNNTPPPAPVTFTMPPITDDRAAHDWDHLVEKAYQGKWGEVRDKLDEFERKWGVSDATKSVREQLGPAREEHDD